MKEVTHICNLCKTSITGNYVPMVGFLTEQVISQNSKYNKIIPCGMMNADVHVCYRCVSQVQQVKSMCGHGHTACHNGTDCDGNHNCEDDHK